MRNRLTIAIGALLLASANAGAQQVPSTTSPTTPRTGTIGAFTGLIDFGFRGDSTTGDVARYERYRDLRQGAASRIVFGKRTDQYLFGARAENMGFHDQRYLVNYNGGRAVVSGSFDQVPLNYSYLTSTPWTETSPGVFTLDAAARAAVQAKASGVVGVL